MSDVKAVFVVVDEATSYNIIFSNAYSVYADTDDFKEAEHSFLFWKMFNKGCQHYNVDLFALL